MPNTQKYAENLEICIYMRNKIAFTEYCYLQINFCFKHYV